MYTTVILKVKITASLRNIKSYLIIIVMIFFQKYNFFAPYFERNYNKIYTNKASHLIKSEILTNNIKIKILIAKKSFLHKILLLNLLL